MARLVLNKQETALRSSIQKLLYWIDVRPPTAEDDRNDHFILGTRWLDRIGKQEYVCVDNTPTKAVWNNTSGGGSGSSVLETPITEETILEAEAYGSRYVVSGLVEDYNIYLPHADDTKIGYPIRFRVKSLAYADKEYTLLAQTPIADFTLISSGLAISKVVAYGTTVFGIAGTSLYKSTDGGVVWTAVTLPVTSGSSVKDIAASTTRIVVVVEDSSTGPCSCVSTDGGTAWTKYDQDAWNLSANTKIWYLNSQFIVCYQTPEIDNTVDTSYIATSSNGSTWSANSAPLQWIRSMAFGGSTYVITTFNPSDDYHNILSSTNLTSWTNRYSDLDETFTHVIYAGAKFIAVGYDGFPGGDAAIAESSDGTTWTVQTFIDCERLRTVVHDGTRFYAFGDCTTYRWSDDGSTWLSANNVSSGAWYSAVVVSGKLLVTSISSPMVQSAILSEDVTALPVLTAGMEVVIYWSGTAWEIAEYITQSGVPPHITNVDPILTDDATLGYEVGQIWINETDDKAFIATSLATGAASWVPVAGGGGNVVVSAGDPTVNDDSGDGYTIGTLWINATSEEAFIAIDVTVGAAIWKSITSAGGAITAADVTAAADPLISGTTVQAQLTSISSLLRGTVAALHIVNALGISYDTFVTIPTPYIILGYNTTGL